MAVVVKSERFPYDEIEIVGPGSYIELNEYNLKKSRAPFGSLSARRTMFDQPEATKHEMSSIITNEKPSVVRHCDSTMLESVISKEKHHNSSVFSSKDPRKLCFSDDKLLTPGPGSYILPDHITELIKKSESKSSIKGKLTKGINVTIGRKEKQEDLETDLEEIKRLFAHHTEPSLHSQRSYIETINTEIPDPKISLTKTSDVKYKLEEQTKSSILTNKIRGLKFHKPDDINVFREMSYIPKSNKSVGPTTYMKTGQTSVRSLARNCQESSMFKSKSFRPKCEPMNIANCDMQTQIMYWKPGPGSYDLSHDISTGQTSRNSAKSSINLQNNLNYSNKPEKFDNEACYRDVDYQRLYKFMSGCRNSVAGPGSYNISSDIEPQSFKKIVPSVGFNTRAKRMPSENNLYKDNKFKNSLLENSSQEFDQRIYKNQVDEVKGLRQASEEKPAFLTSQERLPPNPILKQSVQVPGPTAYIGPEYQKEEKQTLNAFKSKTDRGQLKEDKKKIGTVANYMLDLVEKDKKSQEDRLYSKREKGEKPLSKKQYQKNDNIGDMSKRLEHCFQTTMPLNNLPSTLLDCVGDMHLIHCHEENNPRERLVVRKPLPQIPFKISDKRSLNKPILQSPGPTDYVNAKRIDWNKKTFNINYLSDYPNAQQIFISNVKQ